MAEINTIEPNRLKLIWQSSGEDRTKYVVGELVRSGSEVSLSYFRQSMDSFNAAKSGFAGHAAFPLHRPVYQENVLQVFSRRLPPSHRKDFGTYLQKNRLRHDRKISSFALLGYTGAYLPSDGFSFAIDWRFQELPFVFLMEISGFRYNFGMNMPIENLLGQTVQFEPEPQNQYDRNAVSLCIGGQRIGYVPRYYAPEFHFWNAYYDVSGFVEKFEGSPLRPKVSVLMFVRTKTMTNALASSFSNF